MKKDLFEIVYCHPALKNGDRKEIKDAHTKIEFSKGELFLESGKTANEYCIIEKGLYRSFACDYNGNEITTEFYSSDEILIEVSSLFQRIPSKENLISITSGEAWKIKFDTFQELFHRIEGFREWGRSWMANQLFISKQRTLDMLTKSATERYLILVKNRPNVIRQAPLKYIASYLGVTDTSLSRIRKEVSEG